MSGVVLDASATLAWLFDDERDAEALASLRYIQSAGALVPQLWWWEIANVIVSAERRGRMKLAQADQMFEELAALSICSDTASGAFGAEVSLARRFHLSVYDAAYLELALRTRRSLITRDVALMKAARELQILWEVSTVGEGVFTTPQAS
jgi:predicted nucleic acid-binding protein